MTHTKLIPLTTLIKDLLESHSDFTQISLRIDDRHSGEANIPPSALSFNLKQF